MTDKEPTLIHRWFEEVWNKGRAEAMDEMFDCDGIAHGLTDESGNELCGPEGFKPFFQSFRNAFPDIEVIVEDTVVEGDKIAARCTVKGTHAGEGIGLAATNRRVEFTGMSYCPRQGWEDCRSLEQLRFYGYVPAARPSSRS